VNEIENRFRARTNLDGSFEGSHRDHAYGVVVSSSVQWLDDQPQAARASPFVKRNCCAPVVGFIEFWAAV
jgi:hypothetical protein